MSKRTWPFRNHTGPLDIGCMFWIIIGLCILCVIEFEITQYVRG
jgi:hypothetical protein